MLAIGAISIVIFARLSLEFLPVVTGKYGLPYFGFKAQITVRMLRANRGSMPRRVVAKSIGPKWIV